MAAKSPPSEKSPIAALRALVKKSKKTPLLLDLQSLGLVRAVMIRRPSARNRSPYVADVRLPDGREAIAHVPAMDMGGKCAAGAPMLLKPARDRKGNLVGSDAVGKYGTPKCEFIAQLLHVDEAESRELGFSEGCWVGAHPSLGEKIAHSLLQNGLVEELPEIREIKKERARVAGTDMRVDFVVTHESGRRTMVEVKTVVDTDYNRAVPASTRPEGDHGADKPGKKRCLFYGTALPYVRSGIFPWGRANQKGPDGERVVSARAIRHLDELASVASGAKTGPSDERLDSAVLFIVIRADAGKFRANHEACPSFAAHLQAAADAGVKVVAHRVVWGLGGDEGKAFWGGPLPIDFGAAATACT